MHKKRRTAKVTTRRFEGDIPPLRKRDLVVVEEPLTVMWQAAEGPVERLAATMRTPGEDNELAAGMLFSEGLLTQRDELEVLSFCSGGGPNELNRLRAGLRIPLAEAQRRLAHRPSASLPQSACGLCAFDELANPKALLAWAVGLRPQGVEGVSPATSLLHLGLEHLQGSAPTFAATGASHAVVVVGGQGQKLAAAEDVGRHNACDKALGELLLNQRPVEGSPFRLPPECGIVFSSRLSFELAVKATRAGAAWIASVGAPTHLALELAEACDMPLIGFLSKERHNRYLP